MGVDLKDTVVKGLLVFIGMVIFGLTIFLLSVTEKPGFDPRQCGISEISPDISIDVKEKCRKLRANAKQN